MLTRPSPGTLSQVHWTFDTVAAMKADTRLKTGDAVETRGYLAPGDGGGASYSIVAAATGADDGGAFHNLTGSGGQAKLLHQRVIRAECWGVVLDSSGQMAERSAAFNAAFRFAAALPDEYNADNADAKNTLARSATFSCHTSFLSKDILNMMKAGGGTAESLKVDWLGDVIAIAGGNLSSHTEMLPIPLVHMKIRDSQVRWPRLYCQMICAGIKAKMDLANTHTNLEIRHFRRYGLWKCEGNDCYWIDPTIKQFTRDPNFILNGVDPKVWENWDGDCVVITNKDHRYVNGSIGWGGPCVRLTGEMPEDPAQRIPGQNCYWCGLTAGGVDGGNGTGDVIWDNCHMMQGISDTTFLDLGINPRFGVYVDYDVLTGGQIKRRVDSCIGVLSYSKVSNPSFFDRHDNDGCVHLLFGAQVEFSLEATGSSARPNTKSTDAWQQLDPQIRIYASRSLGGAPRYPTMASVRGARLITTAFYDTPDEIYWNGSSLAQGPVSWNGEWDAWNQINRASGSYAGPMQYKGRRAAGTDYPTGVSPTAVSAVGDYWVVSGAGFIGGVSGTAVNDGDVLICINYPPTLAAHWLAVAGDSAPLRALSRFETNIRAHEAVVFTGENVGVFPQMLRYTPDDAIREEWRTGDGKTLTWHLTSGGVCDQTGATAYQHDAPIATRTYAFANLPSAATMGAGARTMVTNSSVTTFGSVVLGGGSNIVPVYSDGTNWRIG